MSHTAPVARDARPLGVGVWAESLTRRFPLLPVEEEGRLNDPVLRESFVLRTFTHARRRRFLAEDRSPAGLVRFHTAHKLTILAHDPTTYRELGRRVAGAGTGSFEEVTQAYITGLMAALRRRASRGRHVNAMQHLAGFVKEELASGDKRELEAVLADYEHASDRIHTFVIEGVRDNAAEAAAAGIRYIPYVEPRRGAGRGLLRELACRACVVVTDDFPAFPTGPSRRPSPSAASCKPYCPSASGRVRPPHRSRASPGCPRLSCHAT